MSEPSQTVANAPRDRWSRTIVRFTVAVAIGTAVAVLGWLVAPHNLSGHFDVVGYPLYADFDVNRYFDAFYLIAIVFPACTIVTYVLLSRYGPLRRHTARRRAPIDEPVVIDVLSEESSTSLGAIARAALVGAVVGLVVACGGPGDPRVIVAGCAIGWAVVLGTVTVLGAPRDATITAGIRGGLNALAVIACIPLLARVAARAGVTITSTGQTDHFALFPLPLATALTAVALAWLVIRVVRRPDAIGEIDRPLVRYVAAPIGIFFAYTFIPGALGPMDTFGEGEYLAASTRILNGALPWRDIWLIHGLLDDGLKSLVGFAIFGMSRWGATAGLTAILTPAYFVISYLFAAYFLQRRWALVAAAAVAFAGSVFVDWDIRYLLLPLVLIALTATLRKPSMGRGALLGFALVAQAVLVPELTLAIPPLGGIILVADRYRARGGWRDRTRYRGSAGVIGGGVLTSAVFGIYLVATHSLRGFVDYYRNFGDAHSLTGGIPLYTNYALYGHADRYGVLHFHTTPTGLTTRYAIELVLPLVALLVTAWLTTAIVRGGRRLTAEDFVAIAMAGLVLLYFQKSISRGDLAHIGEVFAVSTPLIVVLVARLVGSLDLAARDLVVRLGTRARAFRGRRLSGTVERFISGRALVSLIILIVVTIQAPSTVAALVDSAPGHFVATVAAPAPPPYVPGGPSMGYASPGVLPTGIVENLKRIFAAEAGPHGAVFDLSDAPGIVDFFLQRNPASRFYDISLAITPQAQQLVVADLARNKPKVVLFSGVTGLPSWDFISNNVRQYIVSDYVLNHYRPLVYTAGELVLIADDVTPVPLPKLIGHPAVTQLYFSQGKCDLGNIPDFLDAPPVPTDALTLPLTPLPSRGKGKLYRIDLPPNRGTFQWLALNHQDSAPAAVTIGNIVRPSGADVPWHDISWVARSATTVASVGSCLQWHGFGPTLYLRYQGAGNPTSVRLFNAS